MPVRAVTASRVAVIGALAAAAALLQACDDDGLRESDAQRILSLDFEGDSPLRGAGVVEVHHPENVQIVDEPHSSGKADNRVLRIVFRHPPTSATTGQGATIDSRFDRVGFDPVEEAILRYDVFVPVGHRWHRGGKLPGLAGALPGATPPWGGDYHEEGWSGRLIVRDSRVESDSLPPGRLAIYLYVGHADGRSLDRGSGGERIFGLSAGLHHADGSPMTLEEGRWTNVELRFVMNSPGHNDGIFEGRIDGELGLRLEDVQYRSDGAEALGIDRAAITAFYGGPRSNARREVLYFDDFEVTTPRKAPRRT